MRYLIAALAVVAVAIVSPTAAQTEWGRKPDAVRIVRQALREIDQATEIGLRAVDAKKQDYQFHFQEVALAVSVIGPIKAVVSLERYWFIQMLRYAKIQDNQAKSVIAKILDSIRFQIGNLTKCAASDVNDAISAIIKRLEAEVATIRHDNSNKLRDVMVAANAYALQLHQQAISGCHTHWDQLQAALIANLNQALAKFNALWEERHTLIRDVTHRELDAILERVKELSNIPVRYNVQVIDC